MRGICRLVYLPILSPDAGGADNDPAFATIHRLQIQHTLRRGCNTAECTDQVNLYCSFEIDHGKALRGYRLLVTPRGLYAVGNTGTVDQDTLLPMSGPRFFKQIGRASCRERVCQYE